MRESIEYHKNEKTLLDISRFLVYDRFVVICNLDYKYNEYKMVDAQRSPGE